MAADLAGMAFIPYYKLLMKILDTNEELKKTATGILEQIFWAAAPMAIGGLVMGPFYAMMGGLAGVLLGYLISSDYNSLVAVIRNLNNDQKQQIVRKVQAEVGSASREALVDFIGAKKNQETLLKLLWKFASAVKARGSRSTQ